MRNRFGIVLAMSAATVCNMPAQAMMLQGHVQAQAESTQAQFTKDIYPMSIAMSTARPADYQGTWQCTSTVVQSNVAEIPVGMVMQCVIRFQVQPNGNLVAYWDQNNWGATQCSVVQFGTEVSQIAHQSSSIVDPTWSAASRDKLSMRSSDAMEAASTVAQFSCGQFIGQYKTVSQLTRLP